VERGIIYATQILKTDPESYRLMCGSNPSLMRLFLVRCRCRDLPKDVRVWPVGRLDKDSTGLVLLTDDGQLSSSLQDPGNKQEKVRDRSRSCAGITVFGCEQVFRGGGVSMHELDLN